MKKNILISGLGGSLFPYLHDSLVKNYNLFYVDNDKSLKKLYPKFQFIPAPLVIDPSYIEFVKKLISEHKIDYYIPLIDEELALAKSYIASETKVHVMAPSLAFIDLCLNKYRLMHFLSKHELSQIPSFLGREFVDQLPYPVFAKPVSGRGSRGIRTIHSEKQLQAYYELEGYSPEGVLIQPLVKGQEYTVGVTTNDCNQLLSISSKRIISKKGITKIAVTEANTIIDELVYKLVDIMKPKGPINIQLFITEESEARVFEINPRYSTTSILEIEGGVNVINEYLENIGNMNVKEVKRPKAGITIHRRWESVFYNA